MLYALATQNVSRGSQEDMSEQLCSRHALAKLHDAAFRVQYLLKIYASSQEARPEVLAAELSTEVDISDLQWLIRQLEMIDFPGFSAVTVKSRLALSDTEIQYVPEINVVYLAGDFVESASKNTLMTVLLQEIINVMRG